MYTQSTHEHTHHQGTSIKLEGRLGSDLALTHTIIDRTHNIEIITIEQITTIDRNILTISNVHTFHHELTILNVMFDFNTATEILIEMQITTTITMVTMGKTITSDTGRIIPA
uniref:(northern house mosquito) hypothetical protein n=1 Tax=Culex pipiens TaxID=7175 RepID=A0A8D8GXC0_CULPI